MRSLLLLLWLAGFLQVAIAFANFFLPAKLKYRENLSRVSPIIRQIFVVHSVYIVGVVLLFAAVTFAFGDYPLHAFVNLGQMARYHGVLNSFGFGLCSLVGWTLLRKKLLPA